MFRSLTGISMALLLSFVQEFTQAVELYPSEKAEKGDWIAHLGDAMYHTGQKEAGKDAILRGISFIQERSSQIDSFLYNVWVSGAYLRLAKLLEIDNPEESLDFLHRAKAIIDSDSRLVIRKQQLDAFTKHLNLHIAAVEGSAVAPFAAELAKISNIVFKEYPYFYGVEDDEQFYLSHYCHSSEVKLCLAFDGSQVIGYAIGAPLPAFSPAFHKPFQERGLGIDSLFCIGEVGLLPEYRSRGMGKELLLKMEELVKKDGKYSQICLVHMDESLILDKQPIGYTSLTSLWSHLHYQSYPHLAVYLSWRDVGATDQSMHKLIYWIKTLDVL